MNNIEKLDLIHALAHKWKRVEAKIEGEWREIEYADECFRFSFDDIFKMELRELYVPFKPKQKQEYWCWIGECACRDYFNSDIDVQRYTFGNCFRSEKECLAHPEIKEKLEAIRKELE